MGLLNSICCSFFQCAYSKKVLVSYYPPLMYRGTLLIGYWGINHLKELIAQINREHFERRIIELVSLRVASSPSLHYGRLQLPFQNWHFIYRQPYAWFGKKYFINAGGCSDSLSQIFSFVFLFFFLLPATSECGLE